MTGRVRIHFLPSGRSAVLTAGAYLTAAAMRAGVSIVHDCDGQGVCGTCRVRIEAGGEHLTPIDEHERRQLGPALEEGWRLCCRVRTQGDVTVRVPPPGFAYPPALQREG